MTLIHPMFFRHAETFNRLFCWDQHHQVPGTLLQDAVDFPADKTVANLFANDGTLPGEMGPFQSFGNWESVGSTIFNRMDVLSGFQDGSPSYNPDAWHLFANKFATFPLNRGLTQIERPKTVPAGTEWISKVIAEIIDFERDRTSPELQEQIHLSARKMAEEVLQHRMGKEKASAFQLNLISIFKEKFWLSNHRLTVHLSEGDSNAYRPQAQTIELQSTGYSLDRNTMTMHAGAISRWQKVSAQDWKARASSEGSPPNQGPCWDS